MRKKWLRRIGRCMCLCICAKLLYDILRWSVYRLSWPRNSCAITRYTEYRIKIRYKINWHWRQNTIQVHHLCGWVTFKTPCRKIILWPSVLSWLTRPGLRLCMWPCRPLTTSFNSSFDEKHTLKCIFNEREMPVLTSVVWMTFPMTPSQ